MRTIIFTLAIFISYAVAEAQSPLARRAFDEATRSANSGDFHKAATGYRQALGATDNDLDEFSVRARYNLGVCLYRTGQVKEAVRELTRAIQFSKGTHQRAYYALGMAQTALEDWPKARTAFLKALDLDPKDGEAWFDLAFVHLAQHDYDAAAAAFRMSIDNRSVDSALSHNNLGVIMAMRYDLKAAEESFTLAISLSGGRLTQARQNLEFCRTLKGKKLIASLDKAFMNRAKAT